MARGTIEIDENRCKSCGYCAYFCDRGALEMPGDEGAATSGQPMPASFATGKEDKKVTSAGVPIPFLKVPEKCNGCKICASLCPHFAITTYKYIEAEDEEM
jgi:ferredoxin